VDFCAISNALADLALADSIKGIKKFKKSVKAAGKPATSKKAPAKASGKSRTPRKAKPEA
jgi:hypothetical protein